jgi:hypothetical protein
MIDKLYTVKGICELFGFKDSRTARKIMREMEHTENPLLVTERAVKAWLTRKTLPPQDEIRRRSKRRGA